MKQKLIIGAALILLLGVIVVMSFDLFFKKNNDAGNLYEYDLDKFKKVDSNLICYTESFQIKPKVSKIFGLSIDKDDNLFIAAENCVIVYNTNRDSVSSFKVEGNAECMTAGKDGKLYLGFKKHLEILDTKGKLLTKWEDLSGLPYITSIAVDDSSVYLADAGNKIVHHFNFEGHLINQIGKKDPKKGIPGLFIPSPYFDVLLGHNNELWVINTGKHSFESYTKEGELITTFNKTSMTVDGFSGCCNPTHVAMLSNGKFVTSEKGIERVKIHKANGDFECVVAASDQFVEGTTGLDIAVDSKDRIFILDPAKVMVRIFEKK